VCSPSPAFGQVTGPQPGRSIKVGFSRSRTTPRSTDRRASWTVSSKLGSRTGRTWSLPYQNAQGDGNARNIAKFAADAVDLLAPCTTPNAQATVRVAKGGKIPVAFGCVTDPVSAGILESVERPSGTNVTGLYNPLPIAEQFDLFLRIQPGLKTAGAIYNASESNSVTINRQAKAEAERRGIKWVEATVAGSADVKTTAESLLRQGRHLVPPGQHRRLAFGPWSRRRRTASCRSSPWIPRPRPAARASGGRPVRWACSGPPSWRRRPARDPAKLAPIGRACSSSGQRGVGGRGGTDIARHHKASRVHGR
jgi:hypothetical protein